jgi:hypothetical protein
MIPLMKILIMSKVFGNDSNKSKSDSGGTEGEPEFW